MYHSNRQKVVGPENFCQIFCVRITTYLVGIAISWSRLLSITQIEIRDPITVNRAVAVIDNDIKQRINSNTILTLCIDGLIDVKGVCTSYSEYGKDQHKHVLFIHGLGASSLAWRDIPYAISKYFHTITVDLVGFGGSDKPEKEDYYTIKGFSKFIVDFLEKIGLKNKRVILVGHSLGGYIQPPSSH